MRARRDATGRQRRQYSVRVPFAKAVELCGGEPRLKKHFASGKKVSTSLMADWRKNGVPGAVVAQHLIYRMEFGDLAVWARAQMGGEAVEVVGQVKRVYEKHGPDSEEWRALAALLKALARENLPEQGGPSGGEG